jgi:hypothetical protein
MDLFIGQVGDRQAILPASTVTNFHKARRTLPLATKNDELSFKLMQGQAEPFTIIVHGEAAPPGASRYLKSKDGKPLTSDTIDFTSKGLQVEEVFVWETVPVKRIDAIRAPYQSHRTYTMTLKAKESLKKLDPDSAPAADASSTDPNATPGGPGPGPGMGGMPGMPGAPGGPGGMKLSGDGRMPGMPGGPGGLGGAAGDGGSGQPADPTPRNGLNRIRYLNVTDQCRHLPFAMSLVVDQAHLPAVELALANSRLRIQTTQVEWEHVPGIQQAGEAGGTGGAPVGPGMLGGERDRRPGGPAMPGIPGGFKGGLKLGGPGGPGMPSPPGGFRGMGPPMPGGAAGDGGDEADPNLIELTVYGIAVLYERFPPKKKPEGTDANNPSATPGPTGAPASTPPPAGTGASAPATPGAPAAPADAPKPPAADKPPAGDKQPPAGEKPPTGDKKPPADDKKPPAPAAPPKPN